MNNNNFRKNDMYYSQKTKDYMRKQQLMHKVENWIKTGLMLIVIVAIVALIVMDYLRYFRLSWMF